MPREKAKPDAQEKRSKDRKLPGQRGNPGRPPGSRNRNKVEIAVHAQDRFYQLDQRIMMELGVVPLPSGKFKKRISAFALIEYQKLLAPYAWGKPPTKPPVPRGTEGSPFDQLVAAFEEHEDDEQPAEAGEDEKADA